MEAKIALGSLVSTASEFLREEQDRYPLCLEWVWWLVIATRGEDGRPPWEHFESHLSLIQRDYRIPSFLREYHSSFEISLRISTQGMGRYHLLTW